MNSKTHRRRAFTLIELVLVFGLELVLFGIVAGLLLLVSELRLKMYQSESAHIAAQRLAVQFRADVHNAEKITVEKEKLTLTATAFETIYSVEQGQFPDQKFLLRVERKDGNTDRQERYALPDNSVLWFTEGKDDFAGMTALNIWTQSVGGQAAPAALNPFTREGSDSANKTLLTAYWRTVIAKQKR